MLIDEPSIGLSPAMVNEWFALLHELRGAGMTICFWAPDSKTPYPRRTPSTYATRRIRKSSTSIRGRTDRK